MEKSTMVSRTVILLNFRLIIVSPKIDSQWTCSKMQSLPFLLHVISDGVVKRVSVMTPSDLLNLI